MKVCLIIFLLILSSTTHAQDKQDCACCSAEHGAFDFWIGDWSVTNKDGSDAGRNTITRLQDNCVLQENWISATPGYTGTSYNFYHVEKKHWQQLWLDNQGGSLELHGQRVGQQMILRSSDATNKDGKTFYHQITWTANDDGSVRQLWETFTEGAETVVAFDGLYRPTRPSDEND